MDKKIKFTKICPKCGSTDIGIPPAGLDLKMTQPDYCNNCGNYGLFPEIDETQVKEFKKKLKK